jgi:hypothetical protein
MKSKMPAHVQNCVYTYISYFQLQPELTSWVEKASTEGMCGL